MSEYVTATEHNHINQVINLLHKIANFYCEND